MALDFSNIYGLSQMKQNEAQDLNSIASRFAPLHEGLDIYAKAKKDKKAQDELDAKKKKGEVAQRMQQYIIDSWDSPTGEFEGIASEAEKARKASALMAPLSQEHSDAWIQHANELDVAESKKLETPAPAKDTSVKDVYNAYNQLLKVVPTITSNTDPRQAKQVQEQLDQYRQVLSSSEEGQKLLGSNYQPQADIVADSKPIEDMIAQTGDADNNGELDNYSGLVTAIVSWAKQNGLDINGQQASGLKEILQARQDEIARAKMAKEGKTDKSLARSADQQQYASRVYDRVLKNNADELTAIRSISKILNQLKGNKSSLNDYNAVKAALRSAVPEAVNEGDIANIKNLQNGSVIATLLSKIGANQAITDDDVKSAITGMEQLYKSSFAKVSANINDEIKADPMYKDAITKALGGILRGYKADESLGGIGGQPAKPARKIVTDSKSFFGKR